MAQKRVSATRKNAYANYKASQKWKTNRERKLKKLLAKNPNNLQLSAALKNISYRRKEPKASLWSKSKKATARIIKEFMGKCPLAIFNSNKVVADSALKTLSLHNKTMQPKNKVSFSIEARASIKQ